MKKIKIFEILFIIAGISIFAWLGYLEVLPRLFQSTNYSKWDNVVNNPTKNTSNTKFLKEENINGQIGVLIIPKINLKIIVLEGATTFNLNLGPSHLSDTAYPGTKGNAVISGHRITHGSPFKRIDELKKGDEINFQNKSGSFRYYVARKTKVLPDNMTVKRSSYNPRITLLTCDPPFSAKYRLSVIGESKNNL